MLWGIRFAFIILVLLFILAAMSGCSREYREAWRWGWREPAADVPAPAIRTDVLVAQTRREQLIAEITRLTWVQAHGRLTMENRIALDIAISDRRAELARLDALVVPVR